MFLSFSTLHRQNHTLTQCNFFLLSEFSLIFIPSDLLKSFSHYFFFFVCISLSLNRAKFFFFLVNSVQVFTVIISKVCVSWVYRAFPCLYGKTSTSVLQKISIVQRHWYTSYTHKHIIHLYDFHLFFSLVTVFYFIFCLLSSVMIISLSIQTENATLKKGKRIKIRHQERMSVCVCVLVW